MRPVDWSDRLIEVCNRHRRAQFVWGDYDCAALVRDAAAALGARDPFDGVLWFSQRSALACLRAKGAMSVREFIAARLQRVEPAAAARGDVGFTSDHAALMCPAVIVGAEAVSRDERGWVTMPRDMLVECYRLGD